MARARKAAVAKPAPPAVVISPAVARARFSAFVEKLKKDRIILPCPGGCGGVTGFGKALKACGCGCQAHLDLAVLPVDCAWCGVRYLRLRRTWETHPLDIGVYGPARRIGVGGWLRVPLRVSVPLREAAAQEGMKDADG